MAVTPQDDRDRSRKVAVSVFDAIGFVRQERHSYTPEETFIMTLSAAPAPDDCSVRVHTWRIVISKSGCLQLVIRLDEHGRPKAVEVFNDGFCGHLSKDSWHTVEAAVRALLAARPTKRSTRQRPSLVIKR